MHIALAAIMVSLASSSSSDTTVAAHFWANMVAGSLAAAPAALIATPFDVIKTRLQQSKQVSAFDDLLLAEQNQNVSMVQSVRKLLEEEGHCVFFSGWFERMARSVPQFGVTLAVFDVLNAVALDHGWIVENSV